MREKALTVRFCGTAGDGIVAAGEILARTAARYGLHALTFESYGAEVRGDQPSLCQVRIGESPVLFPGEEADVLVAFSPESWTANRSALKPKGLLLGDLQGDRGLIKRDDQLFWEVPMATLAYKGTIRPETKNSLVLGALAQALSLPLRFLEEAITERFSQKGERIVESNRASLRLGYEIGEAEKSKSAFSSSLDWTPVLDEERMILTGNDAVARGAIAAGCNFFAGYPITPATEILEMMARHLPELGGTVLQSEDEMAALGMALGASFAGAKVMTATSGPGLSLMSELIDLASMAEVPVVIVDVQRGGPSTGLPTKPEQGDLNLAVYGGHGEAPRVVLAPTSVGGCFQEIGRAFDLAEELQLPVLVLTDQFLGRQWTTVARSVLSEDLRKERLRPTLQELEAYQRYRLTASGVSPVSRPGQEGGTYVATGLEHTEGGAPSYDPQVHRQMTAKRFRKVELLKREKGWVRQFDNGLPAEIGLLGWGSTEGAAREAARQAFARGLGVSILYPVLLYPLPEEEMKEFLRPLKQVIVLESNYTGQLARLLRAELGLVSIGLSIPEARPIAPSEILRAIEELADGPAG